MADKKRKQKKTRGKKSELSLDNILDLGGKKEDLALLHDVDTGEEEILEGLGQDLDEDPVNRDELKQFIEELEIYKHRPDEFKIETTKKEKKVKLIEAPVSDDEEKEPVQEIAPSPRKEKREKNKYKVQHEEISSTTGSTARSLDLSAYIRSHKPNKHLLIKPGGQWLDTDQTPASSKDTQEPLLRQMDQFAAKLLEDEIGIFNKQKEMKKKSDIGWMKTVLSSGTLADKMAALTLLVQESPIHSLPHLDTLISMARKKGKRECMLATDTLKDLFMTDILPASRKLRTFSQHSFHKLDKLTGGNHEALDRRILMWYCEGQIKDKYTAFLKALEMMSHDTILATKQKALNTVYQLLVNKPEKEKELLTMLINKVGDPDYKLASKTSHLLTKLVDQHPNMKSVVVREVELLLFRPNIPIRAQYYSICFMNQLSLSPQEKDLAIKLIKIYFSFFKAFVKKGEVDSRMMSGLLKGVNRAYPYAKVDTEYISEQMNTLYKIVHIVNFNTSLQALMLLYQVMDSSQNVSDRYYNALYKKLSDPALKTSSKHSMFLNLLYKSLKKDVSEKRIQAFMKRLLQMCCYQSPPFICGCLILLSEVLKQRPGLQVNISHVEEDSDEEEHFVDLPAPDDNEPTPQSDEEEEEDKSDDKEDKIEIKPSPKNPSWIHRKNLGAKSEKYDYDPYHRNPQYCHADNECVWELKKLCHHFHPTVALFASQILKGETVSYDGDPLQDFTMIRFLDRFVYKNPKQVTRVKKPGMILTRGMETDRLIGVKRFAINSDKYLGLNESRIPVEERFFYKFFKQKTSKTSKSDDLSDEDSDASSINDADFDAYLDKYEEQFDEGKDNLGDLDLDFAGAFSTKKSGKRKMGDEDESEEEDEDDDLSDEEIDFEGDEDFAAAFGDDFDDEMEDDDDDNMPGFNEEDIEFSDNEFEELDPLSKKGKKTKQEGKSKPDKSIGFESPGLFAAAEEFSHLIDESAGSSFDMTGANAMANTDKADVKQLKWEVNRDQWLKGKNWKGKKKGMGPHKMSRNKSNRAAPKKMRRK